MPAWPWSTRGSRPTARRPRRSAYGDGNTIVAYDDGDTIVAYGDGDTIVPFGSAAQWS